MSTTENTEAAETTKAAKKVELGLLRRESVRKYALEQCALFGITATRVTPAFLDDMERAIRNYVRGQAAASVKDGCKTVGG